MGLSVIKKINVIGGDEYRLGDEVNGAKILLIFDESLMFQDSFQSRFGCYDGNGNQLVEIRECPVTVEYEKVTAAVAEAMHEKQRGRQEIGRLNARMKG
jgi:hypothetical protein